VVRRIGVRHCANGPQVPAPTVALDPMEGALGASAGGPPTRRKKRKSSYYSEEPAVDDGLSDGFNEVCAILGGGLATAALGLFPGPWKTART